MPPIDGYQLNGLPRNGGVPAQYFPGRDQQPWFYPTIPPYIPPPPRGRWEWIPDWTPDCAACRLTGICMCVRTDRQVFC